MPQISAAKRRLVIPGRDRQALGVPSFSREAASLARDADLLKIRSQRLVRLGKSYSLNQQFIDQHFGTEAGAW
jgi:hypothetical protein